MACTDLVNDYSCSCNDGWAGKNCDVNINDCEGVTCVGNAYCIDMINDYRCDCSPGFTGRNCETNIDDCADHACANGAACADEVNGYRCDCQSGWQGTLCQVNRDDCVANLCENGATCVDELNGYQCACANGFEGQFCDVNIDDCQDHACQNAATCIDQVARYSCRCPSGYEGPFCENEVDECEVYRPCENDAQCIDGINSYTCACAPGFRGSQCEININDCLPNPCKNGANCTDGTNDYFCDCQEGYTGKTCESDIDDCEDSQCENGATCTDLFNNYTCACAPGFTGIYCQTVMPSDFDLKFVSHGDADYVVLEDAVSKELTAFSLSVWIRTSTANTAIFSYHNGNATDLGDKALSFENPADLKLYIGNEVLSTGTSVNDAKWHHVLVTWASQDGSWTLYRDGNLQGSGNSFQSGHVIPSGGTITLGQDRDSASTSANPSFVGDMHGLHLWDFALAGDLIRHTSYSCHSSIRGNVRAWPDFARGLVGTVLDVSPSVCDDFDECFSGPCEEDSTCIDELGSFSCVCPGGYTGKRCHINIDDCNGHLCQNGGRCVDGIMNYTCACANGFYGYYCEQEEIIARWQKWSPWSACSVTCGGGMRSRHRFCDVPPAEEEDVVDCVGSANETESCNIENCPECVELRSPRHGVIRCEVNNTGEHECVIECDPGYEITDYVYSAYFCGPSTSYLWNHQTHQNPRADLPNCAEQLIPAVQKTDMMVRIPEYNCENSDDQTKVSTAVDAMLQENGEELYCLESGDCRIDGSPQVFNCEHQDRKKRRDATVDEGTYVSFALAFDIPEEFQSSVLPEGGENEDSFDMFAKALLLLYYAKDVMKNMTEDGMLAVTIDGTDYGLDPTHSTMPTSSPVGRAPSRV
ncbi:fibropellin-1-like [Ptychodera flava]|uniref:fibropellin-1-like n=1 Tax=Ptychodera flava TaxID=63121 RepID=UPI00396A215F